MSDPDFENTPHFSRGGVRDAAVGTLAFALNLLAPLAVALLCIPALIFLTRSIGGIFPIVLAAVLICLLTGAAVWNRIGHTIRSVRRANDMSLPFEPDARHRVRIVCWPDELDNLRAVACGPFEPERFRAAIPDLNVMDITNRSQQTGVILAPLMILGQLLFHVPVAGVLTLVAAVLLTLFLLRRPTYIRFVPGQLEILQYRLFETDQPATRRAISLRGPVLISTKCFGRVEWTDETGKRRTLPMFLVFERGAAIRAALAAALSRAHMPEPESL